MFQKEFSQFHCVVDTALMCVHGDNGMELRAHGNPIEWVRDTPYLVQWSEAVCIGDVGVSPILQHLLHCRPQWVADGVNE